ncbi:MAG: hypothetical protein Q8R79_07860, partial [Legionellaceae bacterium]|nr:hypothetical protein [Legionellaceae bacterium]
YLVMDYRKVDTRLTLKQFQTLISAENLAVYLDLQQVEYDSERFIRHILNHTDTPSRVEALITLLEKNNKDPLAARVDLDKLYDQLVLQDQREHERPYDFSGMGPGPSSLGTSH